jgi:hypothetical protein
VLIRSNSSNFSLAAALNLSQHHSGENHDHNPDVDPRGDDLHDEFCGGEAKLQKDAQELSDERQEGM